jgi:hypothetical protein
MYILYTDLYIATFVFFNIISNSKQQNEENITKREKIILLYFTFVDK